MDNGYDFMDTKYQCNLSANDLFQAEGAEVRISGSNWDAANNEALKLIQKDPGAFFVHPFDQETSWDPNYVSNI